MKPHRIIRLSLFASLAAISLSSCKDVPTRPVSILGNYEYTGFDSTESPVVHGALSIMTIDSTSIAGNWWLDTIKSSQNIGPQVGTGSFTGWVEYDTTLHINLNPQFVDNNIFLDGKIQGIFIRGTWIYSTFIGETNRGTFVARKILIAI